VPGATPDQVPALWLPELLPGVVVLEDPGPPSTFIPPPGVEIIADHSVSGERHLVLASISGRIRLCIRHAATRDIAAFVIAVDDYSAKRLAAAAIAERVLYWPDTVSPKQLAPTLYQRQRLIQMLAIHDALGSGASISDITFGLIFPRSRPLNGAAWKGSGERRHASRLVAELRRMVGGGYHKLLLQG
jgi:hypothetical protein